MGGVSQASCCSLFWMNPLLDLIRNYPLVSDSDWDVHRRSAFRASHLLLFVSGDQQRCHHPCYPPVRAGSRHNFHLPQNSKRWTHLETAGDSSWGARVRCFWVQVREIWAQNPAGWICSDSRQSLGSHLDSSEHLSVSRCEGDGIQWPPPTLCPPPSLMDWSCPLPPNLRLSVCLSLSVWMPGLHGVIHQFTCISRILCAL